jgi:hypothetical protein
MFSIFCSNFTKILNLPVSYMRQLLQRISLIHLKPNFVCDVHLKTQHKQ